MTRRTPPQAETNDAAFPVRMLLKVPECGLGRLSPELHDWLDRRIGRGDYAVHGAEDRASVIP